jgi:sulfate transport system substrate-binding protein
MEPMHSRRRGLYPAIFLAALLGYAAWPWLPFSRAQATPPTIVFYGFSILADVCQEAVFPAFQKRWEAEGGGRVEFASSFGGSGTVTNQVIMGVPAQVALLSLESDADRLADAGVIPHDSWKKLPNAGVVNLTPFVILVRPGNPLGIRDFEDLTRPGVRIVHPDPMTSGGANWAIVAEYGSGARGTPGGEAAGEAVLAGVWKNVVAQAASARAARTQFENGFGDALVTYEQEAIYDRGRGRLAADISYPQRTILSEHTLVVIDRNIRPRERALVDRFVRFLWSEEAQGLFVKYGFRSGRPELDAENTSFGRIAQPFRIADFGGWRRARRDIVDGIWKDRVMKGIAAP